MSRQSPQTTNKANNTLASKMPNKNATATTRAESPVVTEEQSLTAFFEKKKNGIAPNTNLIGSPLKFNAHLNEIIINKKKNNNKPPTSTNLLGFPKNKTRKNRTNKSRKNRKNRKNRTRRS
jgi:hypothetical protein